MAAILDMVAVLKNITKNLKTTNNKDLPHQLFQKVPTSNMVFILLGLKHNLESLVSKCLLSAPDCSNYAI